MRIEDGAFEHVDVLKETVTGRQRLVCAGMVLGGKIWDRDR